MNRFPGIVVNAAAVILLLPCVLFAAANEKPDKPETTVPGVLENYLPDDSVFRGQNKVTWYYTEGIKQSRLYNNPELALEYFESAIGLDPDHAPSYYEAANTLAGTDPAKAISYSIKANRLDSLDTWYQSQLARLYLVTHDYDKARRMYEKLIVSVPHNAENYAMLSALYAHQRQPHSAIAILDKAENNVGRIEQLAETKIDLLIGVGLYDRAIEEGLSLVAAYPYNYESYLMLAQLYAETRRDSLAMENYNMALSLNPEGIDIIASLNEYYRLKADDKNYIATARKMLRSDGLTFDSKVSMLNDITSNMNFYRQNYFAVRDLTATFYSLNPNEYKALDFYARSLIGGGDSETAAEVYKSYLSRNMDNFDIYLDIIAREAYLDRPDSVEKYTIMALERFPGNSELYFHYGYVRSYLGDAKGAIKSYEKALKYAETDSVRSVAYGTIGDEYFKAGNMKKSFSYYEKALREWNDNTVILNNYSYYLSEQDRDLEKALEMARRVMEKEPSNSTYIDTYGWVLYKLGRYDEAKKALQQAVALDGRGSSELFLHYGDVLYALGEEYMATVYWNRALEAGHDEDDIRQRLGKVGK